MNICVYGAGSSTLDESYYQMSEKLGQEIAKRGYGLVFGAGNNGVMGATARGAHKENGHIIGIAPSFFDKPGILYPHCSEFISTETMRERKQLLEDLSDATIVAPGGIGTYEEFFEILTLKKLHRIDRALVIFNINHCYDLLIEFMEKAVKEGFVDKDNLDMFKVVDNVQDALNYIESYMKR